MLRFIVSALIALVILPAAAQAQVERGNWELTLAGVGTSNKDFDEHAIGVNVGVGYFVIDYLEIGLRQTISYVSGTDSSATDASTTAALDLHLPLGADRRFVPFVGGNFGYFYGDTLSDSFEYGPEAGVKYFVNTSTFVFFRAEYQIFSRGNGGSTDSSDQQFVYGIGIGFRF